MGMPSLPLRIALAAIVGLVIAWGLVQPDIGPWSVPVALGLSLILIRTLTMMRVFTAAGDEPLHVTLVVWGGVGVTVLALVLGAM